MAIWAISTTYCSASAEMVSIFSFRSSASESLSFFSKDRRHLVQHDLRDRADECAPAMRTL